MQQINEENEAHEAKEEAKEEDVLSEDSDRSLQLWDSPDSAEEEESEEESMRFSIYHFYLLSFYNYLIVNGVIIFP